MYYQCSSCNKMVMQTSLTNTKAGFPTNCGRCARQLREFNRISGGVSR